MECWGGRKFHYSSTPTLHYSILLFYLCIAKNEKTFAALNTLLIDTRS